MDYEPVLKIYKWTVTTPGQLLIKYTDTLPGCDELKEMPDYAENTHGIIKVLQIPRDCDAKDLVRCLNGCVVDSIWEAIVAKMVNLRWELVEPVSNYTSNLCESVEHSPTLTDIVRAVQDELRND
jgi:hypothetical protein